MMLACQESSRRDVPGLKSRGFCWFLALCRGSLSSKRAPNQDGLAGIERLASGEVLASLSVQVIAKRLARERAQDRRTCLRVSDGWHYMLAVLSADIKALWSS